MRFGNLLDRVERDEVVEGCDESNGDEIEDSRQF
jgi:hypothetical protein